jgi:hypothetical protein
MTTNTTRGESFPDQSSERGAAEQERFWVEHARSIVAQLAAERQGGKMRLVYTALEGSRLSERVLSAIFTEFGVPDPRTTQPVAYVTEDPDIEDSFKVPTAEGINLWLSRYHVEGEPLLDLEAEKSLVDDAEPRSSTDTRA